MSQRVIIHIDMDAFFVSVEELSDPSLKGKPVVVGGNPNQRGVVAAASYAARKFGVHSAMPIREAYKRCPQAIFLHGNPKHYMDYSRRVKVTLQQFSPLVEMASIDEAYLDITGCERLLGSPLQAAHTLHETVYAETSLPCSIGIGTSRLIAKISSGLAKPNGLLKVEPGAESAFLAPLDIARMPGIGKVTQQKLRQLGISKIGQIAAVDATYLNRHFGKNGSALAGKAQGLDSGAWFSTGFTSNDQPKSISNETTFPEDTKDPELIAATLAHLVQLVARRLREHELWTRTIQIKLRYENFQTLTRSKTLDEPTQLDTTILPTVRSLFKRHHYRNRAIRLLGVNVGSLQNHQSQAQLFESDNSEQWTHALQAVDSLRDRFGESAVGFAAAMKHGRREIVHENPAALAGNKKSNDD